MGKKKKTKNIKGDLASVKPIRQDKKEAVTAAPGKGGSKSTFVGLGIALVAIAVVAFIMFGGGGTSPFTVVNAEAGVVKLPLSQLNEGNAHYYTYKSRGKDVNFFVLKSSDGVIRAAFDACDVCYRERKGYRQEGDLMVCNNCGQQFSSVKINEIKGGCNPAPLARSIEGGYLVLHSTDLDDGGMYF